MGPLHRAGCCRWYTARKRYWWRLGTFNCLLLLLSLLAAFRALAVLSWKHANGAFLGFHLNLSSQSFGTAPLYLHATLHVASSP